MARSINSIHVRDKDTFTATCRNYGDFVTLDLHVQTSLPGEAVEVEYFLRDMDHVRELIGTLTQALQTFEDCSKEKLAVTVAVG